MFLVLSDRQRLYKSKSCPTVSCTNSVYGQRRQVHVSKIYRFLSFVGFFIDQIQHDDIVISIKAFVTPYFGFSFAMPHLIFVSSKSTNCPLAST